MVKDEIEPVKEVLAEFYPYIFNAYKYFCSFGSIHNVFYVLYYLASLYKSIYILRSNFCNKNYGWENKVN